MSKTKRPPEDPSPWDVAPLLPKGDDDPTLLWTAVGRALTAWEKLDGVQADIFGVLVGSRGGAAVAAYGTIQSTASRTEMVGVAAEVVLKLEPDFFAELKALLNLCGKLGARRNDIAHGVVSNFRASVADENGAVSETDHGHYLVPANYATRRRSKVEQNWGDPMMNRGAYAYTADQVVAYGNHFHETYLKAVKIMFRLLAYFESKWPHGQLLPQVDMHTNETPETTD